MPTPTDAPAAPGPRREAPAQALLRGLAVLEALNRRPISSLAQLAAETGLAKPTLVRVLGILALKNYAERLPNRRGYRIGGRVRALSAGYRASASVVSIARPLLARFTAQHKWPVSIGTLDGDAMRLEASTQQDTAFAAATDRGRLARRLPLLTSALGLAYLAFCPAEERATLLEILGWRQGPEKSDTQKRRAKAWTPTQDATGSCRGTARKCQGRQRRITWTSLVRARGTASAKGATGELGEWIWKILANCGARSASMGQSSMPGRLS